MENQTNKNSTTKTIVVVGVIAIIAYFLFRKPKVTASPPLDTPKPTPEEPIKRNPVDPIPVVPVVPIVPIVPFVEPYRLPEGIYNGQRAVGSDGTQYVISENMKFGLTWEQWTARNYDPYEIVPQYKLDMVPNGGLWQGGLVLPL
jgi:hypothetical protein